MLHNKNFTLVSGQSLGASFNSTPIEMNVYYMVGIQAVWTGGSAAGTLKLQLSDSQSGTYSDYTGSSTTVAGAGDFFWDVTQTAAAWIRVVFTRSSGTGSMTISVNGKTS